MCGIIGYAQSENCVPLLLDGLQALEYRGYDSAGAAVFSDGKIKTVRTSGRIAELADKISVSTLSGSTGIAHTRWATHGKPSERNAHPHTGSDGIFTVVHNGIIENYMELKEKLIVTGRHFLSDTDTEVIAQLLEANYNGDALVTIQKTLPLLEGSYALGILCADCPDVLYCACRESPLLVGKSENGCCIASDTSAIISSADELYRMSNGETAVLDRRKILFYNDAGETITKKKIDSDRKNEQTCKGGFEYYMEKEIYEQPSALRRTISEYISNGRLKKDGRFSGMSEAKRIYIVGCGSAYHAAVAGKYVIEKITRIPVEADLASEFRYRDPIVDTSTLVVIISQSGETADSLAALREANKRGAGTVSIVNVEGSSIARESGSVFYTHAGKEIAVATTKAYSAQLAALYILALYIAEESGKKSESEISSLISELMLLPDKVSQALEKRAEIQELAEKYADRKYAYYIGRNLDYACALEASLKLKEISYIHSEAYAAGELKHGTISLIEKGTLTVAMCCCPEIAKKTASNIEEVMARGGDVLCVVTEKCRDLICDSCSIISVPEISSLFMPSIEIIPMQLFSFFSAKLRNCDIDKPRNLAKSVTVE